MAKTLEEVRQDVLELSAVDRAALVEELVALPTDARWREAWSEESERRLERMRSGADRELTAEEFWSDEQP